MQSLKANTLGGEAGKFAEDVLFSHVSAISDPIIIRILIIFPFIDPSSPRHDLSNEPSLGFFVQWTSKSPFEPYTHSYL